MSVITLDATRYGLLAVLVVIAVIQVTVLSRIWLGRIKRMQEAIEGF